MSWGGFKKAASRAGTQLMQKTGQVEKTVDHDFQEQESKYRTMEKECTSLQKDAKTYLDAIRTMASSQGRIAETISLFYTADKSSEGAMAGHAYKASVDELDNVVNRDLDGPLRATVLEPVGKLNSYFSNVNSAIDKRNHKLIDYDSTRAKVRKLVEKPADDTTKLPKAQQEHDDAREIYELLNNQLIEELPQLVELRIPYLEPSFEAMVRCQLRFAEEGYEKLSGVQRYFNDNIRDDYANGQLDAQVENVLGEMKELAIYGA